MLTVQHIYGEHLWPAGRKGTQSGVADNWVTF